MVYLSVSCNKPKLSFTKIFTILGVAFFTLSSGFVEDIFRYF